MEGKTTGVHREPSARNPSWRRGVWWPLYHCLGLLSIILVGSRNRTLRRPYARSIGRQIHLHIPWSRRPLHLSRHELLNRLVWSQHTHPTLPGYRCWLNEAKRRTGPFSRLKHCIKDKGPEHQAGGYSSRTAIPEGAGGQLPRFVRGNELKSCLVQRCTNCRARRYLHMAASAFKGIFSIRCMNNLI